MRWRLDRLGDLIPLSEDEAGQLQLSAEITEQGWHTLEVSHDDMTRSIDFLVERLEPATWATDIEPLFEAHCSNDACHGSGAWAQNRPDLSSYDTWVELSESIRNRVTVNADMPPPGSGDWGVEDTLLLLSWLDAGLPEGQ